MHCIPLVALLWTSQSSSQDLYSRWGQLARLTILQAFIGKRNRPKTTQTMSSSMISESGHRVWKETKSATNRSLLAYHQIPDTTGQHVDMEVVLHKLVKTSKNQHWYDERSSSSQRWLPPVLMAGLAEFDRYRQRDWCMHAWLILSCWVLCSTFCFPSAP